MNWSRGKHCLIIKGHNLRAVEPVLQGSSHLVPSRLWIELRLACAGSVHNWLAGVLEGVQGRCRLRLRVVDSLKAEETTQPAATLEGHWRDVTKACADRLRHFALMGRGLL